MTRDRKQFVLVERQGWSEKEQFEADSIEEMAEKLKEKSGQHEPDEDEGWWP